MAEKTRRWASSCGRGEIETITAPLAGRLIEGANVWRVSASVYVCVMCERVHVRAQAWVSVRV